MNLLQISLTGNCNLHCKECPMGEFWNIQNDAWRITNSRLLPFLYKYVNPDKWMIELTGGEPALYPELDELLQWLTVHRYHGEIKTNGLLEIKKYGHFPRIAAWHGDSVNDLYPRFFDAILLVFGIQDYRRKAAYCKKHNIPFKTVGLDKDASIDRCNHTFNRVAFINSIGQVLECPAALPNPKQGQYGDESMIDFSPLRTHEACPHCKAIQDFYRFLEPKWKDIVDTQYVCCKSYSH